MSNPSPVPTPVPADPLVIPLLALVSAEHALILISQLELPARVAYRVGRLSDAVAAETKQYHKQHQALLKKYGTERPATPADIVAGYVQSLSEPVLQVIEKDKLEAFGLEMAALSTTPITLASTWLLTLDMLEGQTVSGAVMRGLGALIVSE